MQSIKFEGLGTNFVILIDENKKLGNLKEKIISYAKDYESRFTRFSDDSEVGKINLKGEGTYLISDELARLLNFGLELKEKSGGAFNPAVGTVLSAFGYSKGYHFRPETKAPAGLGHLVLKGNKLTLKGNAKIDLGGWGKGYLIDRLKELLQKAGLKFFLIDGGGDFYGTTKSDGSPWALGIEHPLKSDEIIGIFKLKNGAFANSGIGKRKVGSFHHLIDINSKRPKAGILSCHVTAKDAVIADGLATALMLVDDNHRGKLAKGYQAEFALVKNDLSLEKSQDFNVEFFHAP